MNAYHGKAYQNDGLLAVVQNIPSTEKRILDVGCGAGDNARLLGKLRHELHGITMSEKEAQLAKPHFHSITVANVESWQPPFEQNYFDAILFSHVIEHLVSPEAALLRLKNLLRPGGHLYIAAPNVLFWKQRLKFLLGKFEYTEQGILDKTHLRFFTPETLRALVFQAGFEVESQTAIGHFPWGPLRKLAPQVFHRLDQWLCSLAPGLFGFHLILTAKKP